MIVRKVASDSMQSKAGDSNVDISFSHEGDAKIKASLSTDEIYERILAAITEHRLQPGTQLIEDRLAKIFDVSRTKIREATVRLVHNHIAVNIPNRGAFVASPTAQEAREIFAARRLIEPE